eukprot:371895_1
MNMQQQHSHVVRLLLLHILSTIILPCSAQIPREYKATPNEYIGSSLYDFSQVKTACSSLGPYIPARIESLEENARAWTACDAVKGSETFAVCWIDIVRDDVAKEEFYYLEDGSYGSNPITFFNWGKNQPDPAQYNEACVGLFGEAKWHDVGCQFGPHHVLCMHAGPEVANIGSDLAALTSVNNLVATLQSAVPAAAQQIGANALRYTDDKDAYFGLDSGALLLISVVVNVVLGMMGCYMCARILNKIRLTT